MIGEMFYDVAKVSDLVAGNTIRLFDGSGHVEPAYWDSSMSYNSSFQINKIGLDIDVGMGEQAEIALRLILRGLIIQLKVGDKQKALLHAMVFFAKKITELPEVALSEEVIKSLEGRPRWALWGYCTFVSCNKPIVVPTRCSCSVFVWLHPSVIAPLQELVTDDVLWKVPLPVVRIFLDGESRSDLL